MELDDLISYLQKADQSFKETLDPVNDRGLSNMGIDTRGFQQMNGPAPSTRSGIANLQEASAPQLVGKNITGLTMPISPKSAGKGYNGSLVISAPDSNQMYTRAHEYEHALANQGLGNAKRLSDKFRSLLDSDSPYADSKTLSRALVNHRQHLVDHWGLPKEDAEAGYFSPAMLEGGIVSIGEQLASLSALEQQKGKRLVDDPYVRKNILNRKDLREAYDAVTGLRQTRLDSKDLPPYTRIDEDAKRYVPKAPASLSTLDMLLKLLKRK